MKSDQRYCQCALCRAGDVPSNPYGVFELDLTLDKTIIPYDPRGELMCRIGCGRYNHKPTCPPNIPRVETYKRILAEYNNAHVIGRRYPYQDGHFKGHWREYSTNEIHDLLLRYEREMFRSGRIYAKAFIGGSCKICSNDTCGGPVCRVPHRGRVPLEAVGVDVLGFIKSLGQEYQEPPVDYFWRLGLVFY